MIRADKAEKFLLYFSATLTVTAAVLGLGLAALITLVLVRNFRNLVQASEAVEAGRLDVEVPVETTDEVGRLAASFNNMVGGLRMKERIKDTFGKYMDPRIVARLVENPEFTRLGGERREMTIMFIDLERYTSIAERLSPEDLVRMLNLFLAHMTDAIAANRGVVNDFQGDAVMAYWGPPFTEPHEHAALACKTALDASRNFERFRAEVAAELGERSVGAQLGMRIGISSGDVVSGNIGSAATRKFSVVGDPVNLGSRLEGANKNYGTGFILSERTRELLGHANHARELDLIRVKGKSMPTRIFELLDAPPPLSPFGDGLAACRRQDWAAAEAAFLSCRTVAPDDPVPAVFLERIAYLRENPPGPDWDGV
ncbi:MAG: adenylate/guanylate cyclase domain-containing protein [Rhodospirillaceae bacterium]